MIRRAVLAAASSLALVACPLPQPVAEVARTVDGGTIATPIILPETAAPPESVVLVRKDCPLPPGAQFSLGATVEDFDTTDSVEARWFVDYQLGTDGRPSGFVGNAGVPSASNPSDPQRPIPTFVFKPYDFGVGVPMHVVEVVVSNNFLPLSDPTPPKQRAAPPPFVTQVYRWVFQYIDVTDPRGGRCQ